MAILKDLIVLGNSRITSDLYAKTIYEDNVSLSAKYAPVSHTHTKAQVGLGNVDNTADANKSVNYATSAGSSTNARYVIGDANAKDPGYALLQSGSGRPDSSPAGDTWIFYDNLGGTSTPWGIKHEQAANYISFYGAGNRRSYIDLQNGNIYATGTIYEGGTALNTRYAALSHTHTKDQVGLGNVDNTADANKSVNYANSAGSASSATNADKVDGYHANDLLLNHYILHDIAAFNHLTNKYEYSTDGTNYTVGNISDIANLFDHKDTRFNIAKYKSVRITFYPVSYSTIQWILLQAGYTTTGGTESLLIQHSSDNSTWTDITTTTVSCISSYQIIPVSFGASSYLRLTFTQTGSGTDYSMCCIKLITARLGDQGEGIIDYPYTWDNQGRGYIYHATNADSATSASSATNADTVDNLHAASFLRKDTNDSTGYQYSFTKVNDHAIQVGTIRGRAVGSLTGEYMHLYERVHIGSPSGWGSRNAPANGLSTYGGAWLATDTGNVGIGTTSPETKFDVNGVQQIYQRGNDNTAFKDLLLIKQQNSSETSGQAWSASYPSYGIGFRRYWTNSSGPYGETTCAGIYTTVSSSWRGGLVFRTKNNETQGGTHDVTALRLYPNGTGEFATDVISNGDLYVKGSDVYVGSASGTRCHQQYDSTNECLKFLFD